MTDITKITTSNKNNSNGVNFILYTIGYENSRPKN